MVFNKARYGTAVPYKRIHINEDGTFTDILTDKVYNVSATNGEDVVITGKANHWKESGKKDTSSYFDPMGAVNFISAAGAPILNFTPSNIVGSIREGKDYNSFMSSFMNHDNGGFFSKEYAEKHPYISFAGNVIADGAIGGLANKGIDGYRLAKSFYKFEKPYIDTIANSKLYSNNPIVNTYATYARRFGLPDKARLPYLIRRIKSDTLPSVESDEINMQGPRFNHVNFTTDRPVVGHRKGNWDQAQQTYVINSRNVVPKHTWGSIEPSDMFNVDTDNKFLVNKNDVILLTGNNTIKDAALNKGIKTLTTPELQRVENQVLNDMNKGNRLLARFNSRKHSDKQYWNAVDNAVDIFGRPKLKDYKLLENTTKLKAGVTDINEGENILNMNKKFSSLNLKDAEKQVNMIYPNGRQVDFLKDKGALKHKYNNVFYDPATYAEDNYINTIGFKFGGQLSIISSNNFNI